MNSTWILENITNFLLTTTEEPDDPVVDDGKCRSFDCIPETWQWAVKVYLKTYLYPILILLGVIGNSLALAVLSSRSFRASPTAIALRALAVYDMLVCLLYALEQFIMVGLGNDFRSKHYLICKIHYYFSIVPFPLSTYTLCLTTIERAVSVWFPLKVKEWFTKKRMIMALIMIAICIPSIYLPCALGVNLNEAGDRCQYDGWYWYGVLTQLDLYVNFVIPYTVIFLSNTLILFKLTMASRKRVKEMHTKDDGNLRSTTIMLVTIAAVFLFLCLPNRLIYAGVHFRFVPWLDWDDVADMELMLGITEPLVILNHAINFILYCLTGSRFRKAFQELFCKKAKKMEPSTQFSSMSVKRGNPSDASESTKY